MSQPESRTKKKLTLAELIKFSQNQVPMRAKNTFIINDRSP